MSALVGLASAAAWLAPLAEWASAALLLAGALLCATGGLGLLRLPDFYTRVHAGGLADTLGAAAILMGLLLLALLDGALLAAVKLALIALLLHITSPTGAHALVKAAYSRGLRAVRES